MRGRGEEKGDEGNKKVIYEYHLNGDGIRLSHGLRSEDDEHAVRGVVLGNDLHRLRILYIQSQHKHNELKGRRK